VISVLNSCREYAFVYKLRLHLLLALRFSGGVGASPAFCADDANSQVTFDELMRKFGDDERIGWAVWYVGERYWDFGSMDKAVEKYKYVVEHWPNCERGICWYREMSPY